MNETFSSSEGKPLDVTHHQSERFGLDNTRTNVVIPRRTLNTLALGLAALGLGWFAQGSFGHGHLWEGLLLYAIAIPLFATRFARPRNEVPQQSGCVSAASGRLSSKEHEVTSAQPFLSQVGWVMVGGTAVLSFASLGAFARETATPGWLLYVASIVLFIAAAWLIDYHTIPEVFPSGQRKDSTTRKATGLDVLIQRIDPWLVAIVVIALFLRLYHFPSLPFGTWYDEAIAGLDARRLLSDPTFRPVFWESMNHPAHHLFLFALSLSWLGDNIYSLRAVSVLFGVGAVLTAYLFGRELRGRKWGLLLAFLIATMRWNVNFSRIAMNGIDVPFFEFLTLYFAVRAYRSRFRSFRAMAGTGLSLGLGFCFYTGFRLFALAFIVFGMGMLAWQIYQSRYVLKAESPGDWRTPAAGFALLLFAVWLALMPVTQFAVLHDQVFWQRTQNVSIFSHREDPNLARALAASIQKHLLMFNYKGDNNGRHNIPGAPTLDRLSAVLFALGLGLAVTRRDKACLFFLLLLPAGLTGGILTLDFEAPQSLRSIAAMAAVAYFIALSLDAYWMELKWAARISQPRYALVPAMLVLGTIAVGNATTYFGPQAHNVAVWQAFSTTETLVGKHVAKTGREPVYFFSPLFFNHPSIRFHAPADPSGATGGWPDIRYVMPLPDSLPAREMGDRPVVYYIHPDEEWVFEWARQIYPSAHFETLPVESDFPLSVYVVRLEPSDVTSVQGLEARYWHGEDTQSIPATGGRARTIDQKWPEDAPLEYPFVVQWEGVLYAPQYGRYVLSLDAPDEVSLTLDGETVQGTGSLTRTTLLAQGNHALKVVAKGKDGQVRLSWQPPDGEGTTIIPSWALYSYPVSARGLLGKYYANPDWQGDPTMERVDPVLNMYFHLTPLPRPYSVEWTGALEVPYNGVYSLGLRSVDEARLELDGVPVLETTLPDQYSEQQITLESGLHDMRITYRDQTGRSRIHLYWTRPGGENEIIPSTYLWPIAASNVVSQVATPETQVPPELQPMELAWQTTWGGPGKLNEPRDVAVIGDQVFIADTGNQQVQVWNKHGEFLMAWDGGEEPFEEPLALSVDDRSRLLVLDSLPGWIYRTEGPGEPMQRMGGPNSQMFHPRGMTSLSDGSLVVADTGGGRLVFFDSTGTIVGQMGRPGNAPGQLSEPTDVAVDETNTFYVAEAFSQRLQHLDGWGGSMAEWPIPASIAYDGPHLAWAPDGSLLATAPGDGSLLRYAPDGRLLNRWTSAGPTPMLQPVGIYVDGDHTLYVTDTAAHTIYIFEIKCQTPATSSR